MTVETGDTIDESVVGRTAWTDVTFSNSWVNTAYGHVKYRLIGDEVQIRGRMTGGTLSAACFNLPAGYRPPVRLAFPAVGPSASAATLDINTDGTCLIFASSNTSVDLSGITFSVTA